MLRFLVGISILTLLVDICILQFLVGTSILTFLVDIYLSKNFWEACLVLIYID